MFDQVKRGGYDAEQVDDYLRRLSDAVAHIHEEMARDRRQVGVLQQELYETRVAADRTAETFLAASEAKAQLIEGATVRAEEILEHAYHKAGVDGNLHQLAIEELETIGATRVESADTDFPVRAEDRGRDDGGPNAGAGASVGLDDAKSQAADIVQLAQEDGEVILTAARGDADRARRDAEERVEDAKARADDMITKAEVEAALIVESAHKVWGEGEDSESATGSESERLTAVSMLAAASGEAERMRFDADALLATASGEAERIRSQAEDALATAADQAERTRGEAEASVASAREEAAAMAAAAAMADHEASLASSNEASLASSNAEAEAIVARARDEAVQITSSARKAAEAIRQAALDHDVAVEGQAASVLEAAQQELQAAHAEAAQLVRVGTEAAVDIREEARMKSEEVARQREAEQADRQQELLASEEKAAEVKHAAEESAAAILAEARADAERLVQQTEVELAGKQEELHATEEKTAELQRAGEESAAAIVSEAKANSELLAQQNGAQFDAQRQEVEAELEVRRAQLQTEAKAALEAEARDEFDRIVAEARMEAVAVVEDANEKAVGITAEAQAEHEDLLLRMRRLRALVDQMEASSLRARPPVDDEDGVVVVLAGVGKEDAVAIDDTDAPVRQSRYARRSASLPSLGKEAGKILEDMGSLRKEASRGKAKTVEGETA